VIDVLGFTTSSESAAAEKIYDFFLSVWPDLRDHEDDHVKILSGAKLFGYQTQDIDIVVSCFFSIPRKFSPVRPIKCQPDDVFQKLEIYIESFLLCVEVKAHTGSAVKFEGSIASVKYSRKNSEGWHSASDQSLTQAHSLKQFIGDELGNIPYVTNLIYFSNLEEFDLPTRPNNLISATISPRDFFTVVAENAKPWIRKSERAVISLGPAESAKKISSSRLFKSYIPTDLDRKKIDSIAAKHGFNSGWFSELGNRILILKGRAGTGKTVALLQIANHLYVNNSSRSLILTYNRALVADLRRVLALLGLPASVDDGGIAVESTYSFFYKTLKAFCMLKEDEDFLEAYDSSVSELAESFRTSIFTKKDILDVVNANPEQFAFDCVLIDEAQDWKPEEVSSIKSIFGINNLVISDGMDQLVRSSHASWTLGLKAPEKIVFNLDQSLRMKGNLALFANALSKNLNYIDWSIKTNPQIRGGKVIVFAGSILESLNLAKQELELAFSLNNRAVDLLALVTPSLADKLRDESYFKKFESALGVSIWRGYEDAVRREPPKSTDELRVLQYDSARGMEGWTTFCFNFDDFFCYKKSQFVKIYQSQEVIDLDEDSWVTREVSRWVLMALTRSIDTIFIQIEDVDSEIARCLRSLSEQMPDFVIWKNVNSDEL
jgi:hypothetical protein